VEQGGKSTSFLGSRFHSWREQLCDHGKFLSLSEPTFNTVE
jgi:hypothetical protein